MPTVKDALTRALFLLSEARGELLSPDTARGSEDDVMLRGFIDRLKVIKADLATEIQKREPK